MGGKNTEICAREHGLLREGRRGTRGREERGLPHPIHPLICAREHGLLREGRRETRGWEGRGLQLPHPIHPLLKCIVSTSVPPWVGQGAPKQEEIIYIHTCIHTLVNHLILLKMGTLAIRCNYNKQIRRIVVPRPATNLTLK